MSIICHGGGISFDKIPHVVPSIDFQLEFPCANIGAVTIPANKDTDATIATIAIKFNLNRLILFKLVYNNIY